MFVFSLNRHTFVIGFNTFLAPSMVKPLVDPSESLLKLQVTKEDVLCKSYSQRINHKQYSSPFLQNMHFFPHWKCMSSKTNKGKLDNYLWVSLSGSYRPWSFSIQSCTLKYLSNLSCNSLHQRSICQLITHCNKYER